MLLFNAALSEAQDINLHLTPLQHHLEEIESVEFSEVKSLVSPLLHVVCLIWATSKYYNTPARIIVLLQEICNLLIQQVSWVHVLNHDHNPLGALRIFYIRSQLTTFHLEQGIIAFMISIGIIWVFEPMTLATLTKATSAHFSCSASMLYPCYFLSNHFLIIFRAFLALLHSETILFLHI